MKLGRRAYAEMFGPTVGDRVRLADTNLILEVERDLTVYGEEVKFGGGKVIRDGMDRDARRMRGDAPFVFTNLKTGAGVETVIAFIEKHGLLDRG